MGGTKGKGREREEESKTNLSREEGGRERKRRKSFSPSFLLFSPPPFFPLAFPLSCDSEKFLFVGGGKGERGERRRPLPSPLYSQISTEEMGAGRGGKWRGKREGPPPFLGIEGGRRREKRERGLKERPPLLLSLSPLPEGLPL